MRAPRGLAQLEADYAAYAGKGGTLPLVAFATQVQPPYSLTEILAAELGAAVVVALEAQKPAPVALPETGEVVAVTEPPEAIAEVEAPKPKRTRKRKS